MAQHQPHPDCICQQQPLTQDDLTAMLADKQYDEINAAYAAGRFQFTDTETNQ